METIKNQVCETPSGITVVSDYSNGGTGRLITLRIYKDNSFARCIQIHGNNTDADIWY